MALSDLRLPPPQGLLSVPGPKKTPPWPLVSNGRLVGCRPLTGPACPPPPPPGGAESAPKNRGNLFQGFWCRSLAICGCGGSARKSEHNGPRVECFPGTFSPPPPPPRSMSRQPGYC